MYPNWLHVALCKAKRLPALTLKQLEKFKKQATAGQVCFDKNCMWQLDISEELTSLGWAMCAEIPLEAPDHSFPTVVLNGDSATYFRYRPVSASFLKVEWALRKQFQSRQRVFALEPTDCVEGMTQLLCERRELVPADYSILDGCQGEWFDISEASVYKSARTP